MGKFLRHKDSWMNTHWFHKKSNISTLNLFAMEFDFTFIKIFTNRWASRPLILFFTILCIALWMPQILKAQKLPAKTTTLIYIDQYKDIAVAEMKRTGIPASITLAQGIIESNSGESNLAANFNNHFGIKCKSDWKGETTYQDDDTKQECFRVYPSAIYSYIDHSNFIKTRPNYALLFELDPVDDSAWAYGLKKAGYATANDYPKKLLKVIDDYELSQYNFPELANEKDSAVAEAPIPIPIPNTNTNTITTTNNSAANTIAPVSNNIAKKIEKLETKEMAATVLIQNDTTKPSLNKIAGIETVSPSLKSAPIPTNSLTTIPVPTKTEESNSKESNDKESNNNKSYPIKPFKINQVPVVWATKGTSYLQIAKENNIPLYKIFKYNDISESDLVNQSQLVFLAAKKKEGATTFHIIQKDETWHSISQTEGIQLSFLKSYNSKITEDNFKVGAQLLLIEPKESKNKIVLTKK